MKSEQRLVAVVLDKHSSIVSFSLVSSAFPFLLISPPGSLPLAKIAPVECGLFFKTLPVWAFALTSWVHTKSVEYGLF